MTRPTTPPIASREYLTTGRLTFQPCKDAQLAHWEDASAPSLPYIERVLRAVVSTLLAGPLLNAVASEAPAEMQHIAGNCEAAMRSAKDLAPTVLVLPDKESMGGWVRVVRAAPTISLRIASHRQDDPHTLLAHIIVTSLFGRDRAATRAMAMAISSSVEAASEATAFSYEFVYALEAGRWEARGAGYRIHFRSRDRSEPVGHFIPMRNRPESGWMAACVAAPIGSER